ncbi:unnamed protein product [[Candida] boidinii]|uniref:Unnamed protein product n=1 Tax=Candida boidinii TaxID=5477 RepID=A0A9W6WIZ2_CANBO|nr:unnamed protein product [[Candida] boidinii]GMG07912.1 unnamed protein product [[Candida] boidinii]
MFLFKLWVTVMLSSMTTVFSLTLVSQPPQCQDGLCYENLMWDYQTDASGLMKMSSLNESTINVVALQRIAQANVTTERGIRKREDKFVETGLGFLIDSDIMSLVLSDNMPHTYDASSVTRVYTLDEQRSRREFKWICGEYQPAWDVIPNSKGWTSWTSETFSYVFVQKDWSSAELISTVGNNILSMAQTIAGWVIGTESQSKTCGSGTWTVYDGSGTEPKDLMVIASSSYHIGGSTCTTTATSNTIIEAVQRWLTDIKNTSTVRGCANLSNSGSWRNDLRVMNAILMADCAQNIWAIECPSQ